MTAWRLTKSLSHFRQLVDERWPNRDRASDGTIGNEEHQAEMSGHNPDDTAGSRPAWNGDADSIPEVRAFDMDSDLHEPGTTAQMLVDHIRRLPGVSAVIRYMIYDRTMYHSRDGFAPTAYTGPSAHTEHIHFEGAWSQAADDNVTFDFRLNEVGIMPLTDDDVAKVVRAVWAFDPGYVDAKDPGKGVWPGVSDATYPRSSNSNGTVAPGTALGTLLDRQRGYGEADKAASAALLSAVTAGHLDAQALAAVVIPGVVAGVLAGIPQGADQISQAEVTTAVQAAFADAFGPHE